MAAQKFPGSSTRTSSLPPVAAPPNAQDDAGALDTLIKHMYPGMHLAGALWAHVQYITPSCDGTFAAYAEHRILPWLAGEPSSQPLTHDEMCLLVVPLVFHLLWIKRTPSRPQQLPASSPLPADPVEAHRLAKTYLAWALSANGKPNESPEGFWSCAARPPFPVTPYEHLTRFATQIFASEELALAGLPQGTTNAWLAVTVAQAHATPRMRRVALEYIATEEPLSRAVLGDVVANYRASRQLGEDVLVKPIWALSLSEVLGLLPLLTVGGFLWKEQRKEQPETLERWIRTAWEARLKEADDPQRLQDEFLSVTERAYMAWQSTR